jgi:hypothetical protein
MKRFACPLAILAACAAFQAQADNPPPGLLAKIQISTQAHQQDAQTAGREFQDMKKFARENARLHDGTAGHGPTRKAGSPDGSRSRHDRARTSGGGDD